MIPITVYSSYFTIPTLPNFKINAPNGFNIGFFIDHFLTEYEISSDKERTPTYQYMYYNTQDKMLHLPRYLIKEFVPILYRFKKEFEITEIPPNEFKRHDFKVNPQYKDRPNQKPVINYILNKKGPFRCIELQTGFGKTYCALKGAALLGKKILIISPGHLLEQWYEETLKIISNLTEEDIYVLKGKDSILKLHKEDFKSNYKVYLASISTLSNYALNTNHVYDECLNLYTFLQKLQIGTKIVDECHLNFYKIVSIDLQSNIDTNIYLSATYVRSDFRSNKIFNRVFPSEIRYNTDAYDKYVNIFEYSYSLGLVPEKYIVTNKGYSQIRFEKWLMKKRSKLFFLYYEVILPSVQNHFIDVKKEGQKCLILVRLKDFAKTLCSMLQHNIKDLNIGTYFYETPVEELENLDIIISTIGSLGVGSDIKNLKTVILFESFAAKSWILQTLGRLRKLKNDTPEFVYLQCTDIRSQLFHRQIRRGIFKDVAKKFIIRKINTNK